MNRCRAVILDLDGTLVDSAPDLLATANTLLAETARAPISLDEIIPMIGDGIPTLVARVLRRTGSEPAQPEFTVLTNRFVEIYLDPQRPQLTRVYEDVPGTLVKMKQQGFRLAVCTNKIERAARSLLRQVGLEEMFDAVVGGDTVPATKPDPAHVLAALERLHARSGCAVTVGDSRNDIAAGLAAGTAAVAVTYGYGDVAAIVPQPNRVIDRFADLPAVLEELTSQCRVSPPQAVQ